jgi:hypothetical protein
MLPAVEDRECCSLSESESACLEVADIFRNYGGQYRASHKLSGKQQAVMFDIEHCRRSYFGYHVDICDHCGHTDRFANSCRNRHCPKCQGIARRLWVNARLEDLLPIPYYHVTFTLPHMLNPFVGYNRELIYNLLFDCAAETLLQFGRDPKWLGALIGFYGILHTWGGKLWQHLHLHFIVAGGGLTEDGRWAQPKYKGKFIFPVKALSRVFRGKFIAALKSANAEGRLVLPPGLRHLRHTGQFENFVDALVARNWVVFAKPPFADPQKVVRYIGRYTHRIAISNSRLTKLEDDQVYFHYKDYRDDGKWKQCHLKAEEFIKRFLMHLLPRGFHRIRHYGFLSNGRCKAKVAQIRKLLSAEDAMDQLKHKVVEDHVGVICPVCEKGSLTPICIVHRLGHVVLSAMAMLFFNQPVWDTS